MTRCPCSTSCSPAPATEGITYPKAVALLGVTDAALLDEMMDALAASDGASVFGVLDKVSDAGHDPRRFGADLLQRLRDLVILQAVPEAATKGLIDAPEDQLAAMTAQADRLSPGTLTRYAEILHTGLTDMRGTTSPRLVLELLCARMLLPAASLEDGALLQRLERLERRLSIAAGSEGRPGSAAMTWPGAGRARFGGSAHGSLGTGSPGRPQLGRTASRAAALQTRQLRTRLPGFGGSRLSRPAVDGISRPRHRSGSRRSGTGHIRPGPGEGGQRQARPRQARPTPVLPSGVCGNTCRRARGPRIGRTTGSICLRPRRCRVLVPRGPRRRRRASGVRSLGRRIGPIALGPIALGPVVVRSPRPHASAASDPQPPPVDPGAVGVTDVRRLWSEVLEAVKRHRRTTQILLEQATVTELSGRTLHLRMPTPGLARKVEEPGNADVLKTALREILGVEWIIRCDTGPSADRETATGFGGATHPISTRRVSAVGVGRRRCRRRPASHRAHRHGLPQRGRSTEPASRYDGPDDPDDDIPDDYEDVRAGRSSGPVIDPEQAAIELLTAQLGARPLDPEA